MLVLDEKNPETLTRWSRAERHGLQRDSAAYPVGTSGSDLAVRRDRLDNIFREERALFEPITAQLTARSLVAIVADPDGVILASHGGGDAFSSPATTVRLVEGACWSEAARGTNAIGTAIVERRSVAVLGGAHFETRNQELFCYAKPILDVHGGLVAVLDVTGPMVRHDAAVGLAVEAAGASLERALRHLAYSSSGASAFVAIERLVLRSKGPALLVEASGAVRVANAAARATLGLDQAAACTCERVFGLPFRELEAVALRGGGGTRFETTTASHDVELDPIAGPDGRTLAVLVYLESRRGMAVPSRVTSPPVTARSHPAFDEILATDTEVLLAKDKASRFASTALPVLLLAETGTGKELFARALHGASPRARGPFVALNCGALATGVLESELFGYAPGAFTGALRTGSLGKLGTANGGSLFLDEIAEMPDALQAALLRVLDDGVYHRVGDTRPSRTDFRLICATCRDLPALVASGAFRRDLFYRIHGACVTIPSLRDRSDRLFIARGLLARLAGESDACLTDDAAEWILEHDWPGNVRELKSALTHALALAGGAPIERSHFPRVLVGRDDSHRSPSDRPADRSTFDLGSAGARTRQKILDEAVRETMRACDGNVSETARRLGVARSTIYRAIRDRDD